MSKEMIPYLCLVLAIILIYVPRLVVAWAQTKEPGGLDNRNPRQQQAKLTGIGARAQAAHQNSLEAFAPFAAALLACKVANVDSDELAFLSMAFIAFRILYVWMYLSDRASARTGVWLLGFLSVLAMASLPLLGTTGIASKPDPGGAEQDDRLESLGSERRGVAAVGADEERS